jgi:DNA mismatch repair protein MutS
VAKKYFRELRQRSDASHAPKAQQDLLLMPPSEPEASPAIEALANLDPDAMTPKDALDALYKLKKLLC